ncbi:unnamed protein product [Rangifer tarandus platyrhynchus]|uniref:Uncharacterized protein n=1 Tax=Rangifer tarandus platyrhynchus TaxID=3082113 RepID=A0ABN8Y5G5_RANTA|nr:unnamed protein product [Rangifer tarandus platyrhynchus]
MPAGGSEDRGPRSAAGPNQTPPGPRVPEPQTGVGTGGADRGRAWRGPGREGDENSAPLSPTPSPGMHTRPAARGPGNTPDPRAGPGLLARVAGVWGRGGFGRAVAGAPRGKVGPAGSTRHIRAKTRRSAGFLKAPPTAASI